MLDYLYRLSRRWGFLDTWDLLITINIVLFSLVVLLGAFNIELADLLLNAPIYLNIFMLFGIFTIAVYTAISVRSFTLNVPPERVRRDLLSQFSAEEAQLRLQIVTELDNDKKKELMQHLEELRQRHDSLLNENLKREDGTFVTDWREVLLVSRKRLVSEGQRLLERNRKNFKIGILMSFGVIGFLIYYTFVLERIDINDSLGTILATNVPIFSISTVIEGFSLFFLRLYVVGEREFDRNKNELTNIELRLTAGLMMANTTEQNNFDSVANALSKEERNFVLGGSESSGEFNSGKLMKIISKLIGTGTK